MIKAVKRKLKVVFQIIKGVSRVSDFIPVLAPRYTARIEAYTVRMDHRVNAAVTVSVPIH